MKMFEEGKMYRFFVDKILTLPDSDYFLLIDEWNKKHLLPQKYYTDYSIKIGTYINCYVNKINCNGKIFLEPEHPIYKIGDIDNFIVTRLEERVKKKSGEIYYVALAQNKKTSKAAIINYNDFNSTIPFSAKCEVIKIKKAEVLLHFIQKTKEPF
ncbi:MAG: hypothetical protein ACUVQP_02285 [Bacteroidales bacterium]